MTDHRVGTREEWQAAREELAKLEAEHAELGRKATEQRRQLPWVPVEQAYEFDTADGKKTLAELFDGRSQLLAYNIMFGPDYEVGACPGCSNLGDELDAARVHLEPPRRDADLLLPGADRSAHRLQGADGVDVPLGLDVRHPVPLRLRARHDPGAGPADPRGPGDARRPAGVAPGVVGAGRREARGRPARGSGLHRLRAGGRRGLPHVHGDGAGLVRRPYHSSLLDRTPKPQPEEPRAWRKDEYPVA